MFQAEEEVKESLVTGFVGVSTMWPESLSKPPGVTRYIGEEMPRLEVAVATEEF